MWIFWIIAFVVFFLILAQLISHLPSGNFVGLRKIIPEERPQLDDGIVTSDPIERLSGQSQPFFETLLHLEEKTPEQLIASWLLSHDVYSAKLAEYHQEHVDLDKAVLRLSYTGGRRIYEDYPIRLSDKSLEIIIDAPGSTMTAELGFYTKEHNFISMVTSNDVTIPQ